MNQEQLLDHVAELLRAEAEKGPGTLLLIFDTDYKILRIPKMPVRVREIFHFFDAEELLSGLPPSVWLNLSKILWTEYNTKTHAIKFPGQPSAGGGKPGRKPKPQNEDPKTG